MFLSLIKLFSLGDFRRSAVLRLPEAGTTGVHSDTVRARAFSMRRIPGFLRPPARYCEGSVPDHRNTATLSRVSPHGIVRVGGVSLFV